MASAVQLACGVFAIATPVLLGAGYYAQVLLDRLGDGRDLLLLAVTTGAGLIGEAAALVGVLRPGRVWEAIGAVGTALSAAGVVLVPLYALRLRAKRRRNPPERPSYPPAPPTGPHTQSAPPWGGADQETYRYSR